MKKQCTVSRGLLRWSLLVLCANSLLTTQLVFADSASKLNLGIWLPPMTLKLPKFNMPKIKISATIKPRRNQPPLKIHLPEVSLNAKALGDDDGWSSGGGYGGGSSGGYGGSSGGYGGSNSGGYSGNSGGYGGGSGSYGNDGYGSSGGGYASEGHYRSSNQGGYSSGGDGHAGDGYGNEGAKYGGSSGNGYESAGGYGAAQTAGGYGGNGGAYAAATNERYRPAQTAYSAPEANSGREEYSSARNYNTPANSYESNSGENYRQEQAPQAYGGSAPEYRSSPAARPQQENNYNSASGYGSRLSTQPSNSYEASRSSDYGSGPSGYGYAVAPTKRSYPAQAMQSPPTYGPTPAAQYSHIQPVVRKIEKSQHRRNYFDDEVVYRVVPFQKAQ